MPRLLLISLVIITFIASAGCTNSGRRGGRAGRGGLPPTGADSGVMDPDAGRVTGGEDAAIEDTTPPSCDPGFTRCGEACVDIVTDDFNCGGCDIVCTGGYCESGFCIEDGPTCPSPRVTCGESCVDTQSNSVHCGGCFSSCEGADACRSGFCVSTCTPSCGSASCGSDGCGGSCGTCGFGTTCRGGFCESTTLTGSGESCSSAIPIVSSTTFTFAGRSANHTPFSCGTSSARPDVAFAYTPTSSGSVTVTARGASGADTMVAIYSASSCTSTSAVACNDDSPTGVDSRATFTATAFSTYYIVVAPYSATTPTDTITLTVL